ncbi:hypothetical protein ACNKHX_02930 [Shigella flexneri]
MVDAAIVMIENAHKRLEKWQHQHPTPRWIINALAGDHRYR